MHLGRPKKRLEEVRVASGACKYTTLSFASEVAEITFSDSDSAPVPKFLNPDLDPGLKFFQI